MQRTVPAMGFTLIELLVVIGIIAVLAGMLMPLLARGSQQAKIKACKVEMKGLESAIVGYDAEYSRFPVKTIGASDLTFGYANGVAGVPANSEVMIILMDLNTGGEREPRDEFAAIDDVHGDARERRGFAGVEHGGLSIA